MAELEFKLSPEDKDLFKVNYCFCKLGKSTYVFYKSHQIARVIMERALGRKLLKTECADHINNDTLDNRRENLRIASRQQNNWNRSLSPRNKTGYKGVSILAGKSSRIYTAHIKHNYKSKHLGIFETKEEAALAYNKAAKELFGEYAWLNKVGVSSQN